MPFLPLRWMVAASLLALSCAASPTPAPATATVVVAAASSAPSPSPAPRSAPIEATPWSAPGGCGVQPSETMRNTLIRTEAQLRAFVRCKDGAPPPLDLNATWLAVFSLQTEGGTATPGKVHDDGKTLTLDVQTTRYCGGMAPRRIQHTFVYRVAPEPRELRVNRSAANEPPCPTGLP